jgi:hypothetical protein
MSILQKILNDESLSKEELEAKRAILLLQIAKMKEIIDSLDEKQKKDFSKALSLLMLYYPEGWAKYLLNNMDKEVVNTLVEEENYIVL